MCGIAGIFHFDGRPVDPERLARLNQSIRHRGPDGDGQWIDGSCGLAHRRLSIVDLSEAGSQPMTTSDKRLWLTYNGELYNFQGLRSELSASGVRFRSGTDSEVLLHGYREWGIEKLLEKIDGMFAFVLVDRDRQMAWAARDRFGKKPLYSALDAKSWHFCSELPGLNATLNNLTPDFEALDYYLTELSVPQPRTIWKEVQQVRPGHCLEVNLSNGSSREFRYWQLAAQSPRKLSVEEALEELEPLLIKAVMKRTIGDVPVGTFLSGGVDSGLVTSLLAQNSASAIPTFSVGFTYSDYNELPYARQLAERYNTDHHEIMVEADVLSLLPDLIGHVGEPFADSSLVPSWLVCREIAGSVKVALSGDGGDEIFGGYHEYGWAHQADQFLKRSPGGVLETLNVSMSKGLHRLGLARENQGNTQAYARMPDALRLYREMGFHPTEKAGLYHPQLTAEPDFAQNTLQNIWRNAPGDSLANKLFHASLDTRLLNDYLVKVDRASMAHALEVRSPFLDTELATWSRSISNEVHLHQGMPKYLLKRLAQKHVAKDILTRPKQGFGMPMSHWFRNELKEQITQMLTGPDFISDDWIDPKMVNRVVSEHTSGQGDHTFRIWSLLCLNEWRRQFYPG